MMFLTKAFSSSVSVGIGSQKGVLRSLVRELALAVKDANPRISIDKNNAALKTWSSALGVAVTS